MRPIIRIGMMNTKKPASFLTEEKKLYVTFQFVLPDLILV